MRRWLIIAVLAGLSTTSQAQTLDRRAELQSPVGQILEADPGETVMDFRITTALLNAFGGADIFGRRKSAGRVLIQFLGIQDGTAYFSRQNVTIDSNETTLTRTPIIIPDNTTTQFQGHWGNRPFGGNATTQGTTVIPPRQHSTTSIIGQPVGIAVRPGKTLRAEGRTLTVHKIIDGSIQYSVR